MAAYRTVLNEKIDTYLQRLIDVIKMAVAVFLETQTFQFLRLYSV
jgi:hypothetical protein